MSRCETAFDGCRPAAWIAALACAGGLAAPVAAQQVKVDPYAVIDVFVESVNTGSRWQTRAASNSLYASRLGVNAGVDLGSSVSITGALEAGVDPVHVKLVDDHAIVNRQAWVGLEGKFGKLRFGRQNSILFAYVDRLDAGEAGTHAAVINNFSVYTFRADSTLSYATPSVAGFHLEGQVGLGGRAGPRASEGHALGLVYDRGPVSAMVACQTITTPSGATRDACLAGGNMRSGRLTYYLALERSHFHDLPLAVDATEISVKYQMDPRNAVALAGGYLHDKTHVGADAWQASLLLRHSFSKALQAYAAASIMSNERNAAYTLAGTAVAGLPVDGPGANPQGFQLGLDLRL